MLTIKIYLDLETLPPEMTDEELQVFKDGLSAPGTMKKPEKIEEWLEANWEKKYRDLAKKSSSAHIATFAYAFTDRNINCIFDPDRDEKGILEAFYEDLNSYIEKELEEGNVDEANYSIKWIGYNNRSYDMDLLWKRAKFYKLEKLAALIPRDNKWSKDIIDLKEVFNGVNTHEFTSQDYVCKYFGIQGKPDDIDGSQVYDYWMRGEYQKIADYNVDDVEKVIALYDIMVG
jgi:hypothetical protein